jgi:hypothetical protein
VDMSEIILTRLPGSTTLTLTTYFWKVSVMFSICKEIVLSTGIYVVSDIVVGSRVQAGDSVCHGVFPILVYSTSMMSPATHTFLPPS